MARYLTAKAPGERVDYVWRPPLDGGDTIASFTGAVIAGSAQISNVPAPPQRIDNNTAIQFFMIAGADEETTELRFTATTTGGRIWEETLYLITRVSASLDLAEFRQRFPDFAAVSDSDVMFWIDDAGGIVPDGWTDARTARITLAAHNMAVGGIGGGLPTGVTSFRSGAFSGTISEKVASASGFRATRYGIAYLNICRRNGAGFRYVTAA